MYSYKGSSTVTLPDRAEAVQNLQLEFNSDPRDVDVQVISHSDVDVDHHYDYNNSYDPIAEAKRAEFIHSKKEQIQKKNLEKFKMNTKKRIKNWADLNKSACEESKSFVRNRTNAHNTNLENVSFVFNSPTPEKAQEKQHYPTNQEEVIEGISESEHRQLENPRILKPSNEARSRMLQFSTTRNAAVLAVEAEVDVDGSNVNHTRVLNTTAATTFVIEDTSFSSAFVGKDLLDEKARIAKKQALVRRREMEVGRQMARRRREILEREVEVRKEQNTLTALIQQKEMKNQDLAAEKQREREKAKLLLEKEMKENQQGALAEERLKREAIRYANALQDSLLDKIKTKQITIPALCNCKQNKKKGLFLTSKPAWESCANNCRFYNNPQEYARALSDISRSLDL
mmetsp:Transcript_645/g.839  ORF Transcript_645/g.839 Transcript_645/m.839 type:complete len:400 (-) Transcript_645:3007-4206(-)